MLVKPALSEILTKKCDKSMTFQVESLPIICFRLAVDLSDR
jgi:hypothetical protein